MNIQPGKGTRKALCTPITSKPPETLTTLTQKKLVHTVFSLLEGNPVLDTNFFGHQLGNGLASEINH